MRLIIAVVIGTAAVINPLRVAAFEWRATWQNTWGYSMMSPADRSQFEQSVRNLKNMKECEDLLKHHNIIIRQRIEDWVITPKRPEPVDTCAELKAKNLITD